MWNRYEPPADEQPEQPAQPEEPRQPAQWPVLPAARAGADRPAPYRPRAATRPGGSLTTPGAFALGLAGIGVVVAVAAGGSISSQEAGTDDWDACIASYQDDEPGLLTPADLCEIGHDRPDGYAEYDGYDFDPYEAEEFDTWSEWEDSR